MSEEPGARPHTNAWLGAVGEGAGFIPTAAVEDYNERARRENGAAVQEVRPPSGVSAEAPHLAPIADVEEWIARWRRTREP